MFYVVVTVKLFLGFLALLLVINLTGKGNLAPASASDQVQNYVLGGIVGGVIYNPKITIAEFLLILVIWFALVLSLRWLKKHNGLGAVYNSNLPPLQGEARSGGGMGRGWTMPLTR